MGVTHIRKPLNLEGLTVRNSPYRKRPAKLCSGARPAISATVITAVSRRVACGLRPPRCTVASEWPMADPHPPFHLGLGHRSLPSADCLAAYGRGVASEPAGDRSPPPTIRPETPVTNGCLRLSPFFPSALRGTPQLTLSSFCAIAWATSSRNSSLSM